MAAALLQMEHRFCELTVVDVFSVAAVVDLPVLAEATQEIAVREEDRSGAPPAD